MPTRTVFLKGKAKWARLREPDTAFEPAWKVQLYLDPESLLKVMELQEEGLLNEIKQDEEGKFVTLRRKTHLGDKLIGPPILLDGSKTLEDGSHPFLDLKENVGNGSDITCKMQVYGYNVKFGKGKKGIAMRLDTVRVDSLVPFEPFTDFNPHDQKRIKGLMGNPAKPEFD